MTGTGNTSNQDTHIFISHCTEDDEIVKTLGESMEIQRLSTWVDSRNLLPGAALEEEIKDAIGSAQAFIAVLSPNVINSPWVPKEIQYALDVKKQKKTGNNTEYPIIPVLLDGFAEQALALYFKEEPVAVKIKMGPGGVNEAMPRILAALGMREAGDIQSMLTPEPVPMEELVLTLSRPGFIEENGKRRARAEAQLTHVPAGKGTRGETRDTVSLARFMFTAPLGPIENDELRWYLEDYHRWPTGVFTEKAKKVEKDLPRWGHILYNAIFQNDAVRDILAAWTRPAGTGRPVARRFTVYVDTRAVEGAPGGETALAHEAATVLLALPWELLRDERGYLFLGASPVRVRRRLPNVVSMEGTLIEPPIRTLLVSPRPEDDRAEYFDHRSSALPLVSALEQLGDLADVTVLETPAFPAMVKELHEALEAGRPYHIIHFDGHGVYDKEHGLAGLCFEHPEDGKKAKRRSKIVTAGELAETIRDFRIPLVFLDACRTARTDDRPEASVAAALLKEGTASVIAMSHSVLVTTAARFVKAFYTELAKGSRVGKAMLEGQKELFLYPGRGDSFVTRDLELLDWFVPVLYQEQRDIQIMTRVPSREMRDIDRAALRNRFGQLPQEPGHRFTGRSRELLRLERLLGLHDYVVVCGQGGEGKTTLAAELARWLIRIRRFERGVFVSVEDIYDVRAVVDQIGGQLIPGYMVSKYDELSKALLPIEARLREHRALIVLDNLESILPRSGSGKGENMLAARFESEALAVFFQIARQLLSVEGTRIIFTSREALPEPFDAPGKLVTLGRLSGTDAVQLVHLAMTQLGIEPKEDKENKNKKGGTPREVEELVESVNCHARSLVLLAPYIKNFGVARATENLTRLMAKLQKKYPDERERSLFASVELSLGRIDPETRKKITPLALFQGGANIIAIQDVLELTEEERDLLVGQLVETGLAEEVAYGFIRFHPALCPYLLQELEEPALSQTRTRWAVSMVQLSGFLYKQQFENAQLSATLTTLELPNLVRLLDHVQAQNDPGATAAQAGRIEQLIANLGRPHLLERVAAIREAAANQLGDWCNTRFKSWQMKVERLLGSGNIPGALTEARALLDQYLSAGTEAYPGAEYDTAVAHFLVGRAHKTGGGSEAALQSLDEAYQRFSRLEGQGDTNAAKMAAKSLGEKGECLIYLGRLDESAAAYEEAIRKSEEQKNDRAVAVGKGQLGTVRMFQKRYDDAIKAYDEALNIFETIGEPASVATAYHQIGMTNEEAGRYEAAEQAYRKALSIRVQYNIKSDEASSIDQLGILFSKINRLEESVTFHKKAANILFSIKDLAAEGRSRSNLAIRLIKLARYDDARREIQRAIECKSAYGHAAEPWKTWMILHNLEQAVGNHDAADKARERAIQLYLAYRRDGGENHEPGGRLCLMFLQAFRENRATEIAALLEKLSKDPQLHPFLKVLIPKLQAILDGSRDPRLAEDKELHYYDAAEILILLETLGEDGGARTG